jgi:hypothetical protein
LFPFSLQFYILSTCLLISNLFFCLYNSALCAMLLWVSRKLLTLRQLWMASFKINYRPCFFFLLIWHVN